MASAQLYYEEVEIGESVRPMYQYMDQMQLIKWAVASGNRGPGHFDLFHTRSRNGNDPSVTGQLKTSLLEKMVRDWAGPRVWITKMSVQYRKWDHFFDLKTFNGTVTDKRVANHRHLVDLEVQMANGEGQVTTRGNVTVVFPTRTDRRE